MTAKQFFKSTTFKCLITLLCVLLISGIFLTVMNSLLKVTDEEKFNRAINKIYGKSVTTEAIAIDYTAQKATIDEAYRVKDDGNYLIKATGTGGFDSGTVTCWVVVAVKNGAITGIDKVVIDSNKAQSYIGNINNKFLSEFSSYDGEPFDALSMTKTGATMSARAICNAVNASIDYVNEKWLGNVTTAGTKLVNALAKLYGETQISIYGVDENGADMLITEETETVTGFITAPVTQGNATVSEMYKVVFTENDTEVVQYVLTSTGTGGFEKGTVTCMTAASAQADGTLKIFKVIITDNEGQSYIGKINHLDKYTGAIFSDGIEFTTTDGYVSTGATMSSTAINNAVNGALSYLLGNIPTNDNQEGGDE
ncbi:MAG: hypothetical protein K2N23_02355 [Clostridia bacterium]|nr:hypothetical protein [Clostridia bacterium]